MSHVSISTQLKSEVIATVDGFREVLTEAYRFGSQNPSISKLIEQSHRIYQTYLENKNTYLNDDFFTEVLTKIIVNFGFQSFNMDAIRKANINYLSKSVKIDKKRCYLYEHVNTLIASPKEKALQLYGPFMDAMRETYSPYLGVLNGLLANANSMGFSTIIDMVKAHAYYDLEKVLRNADIYLERALPMYYVMEKRVIENLFPGQDHVDMIDIYRLFFDKTLDLPKFSTESIINLIDQTCVPNLKFKTSDILFDLDDRPNKIDRPFMGYVTEDNRQKIVVTCKSTNMMGNVFALFHESGHAIHFSNISEKICGVSRSIGDYSLTESVANLFEMMLLEPEILSRLCVANQIPYNTNWMDALLFFRIRDELVNIVKMKHNHALLSLSYPYSEEIVGDMEKSFEKEHQHIFKYFRSGYDLIKIEDQIGRAHV